MSAEQELEVEVRRYAVACPRDRLAAAYEFASMLDGYDPAWWSELMRARNCGEMNGKPRRGSCDGDPEIVRALLPASGNISMAAEGSVIDALAGADVYQMEVEVDADVVTPSDVGLGLAVCLSADGDGLALAPDCPDCPNYMGRCPTCGRARPSAGSS